MTGDDEREREREARAARCDRTRAVGGGGESPLSLPQEKTPFSPSKSSSNDRTRLIPRVELAGSCARRQQGKEKCGRRGWEEWRGEALSNGTCRVNMGWGVDNMPIWDTRRGEPGSLGQEKKKK